MIMNEYYLKELKRLHEYPEDEHLDILRHICGSIYIARNITMSEQSVLDSLKAIDILLANSPEDGN
jgi:hypothetical protein